jgi:V/A-type H+-transporting ATPase subunit E
MELQASKGVQELIDRLKSEGIKSGETQAQKIIDQAHQKSRQIIADAKQEAEAIRKDAREDAKRTQAAAEEAIRIAARDALLSLKSKMAQMFSQGLYEKVAHEFNHRDFLRQLLLEVCRRKVPELSPEQEITVLLPEKMLSVEDLKSNPSNFEDDPMAQFILSVAHDLLEKGVNFETTPGYESIKVRLEGQQVVLDLSDNSAAGMLLQYLLPRFRAIVEGYIQ